MENYVITQDEINEIRTVFKEIRAHLQDYMNERQFPMSNVQLFVFLSNVPAALAIASDKEVDEEELKMLEKIARKIDVNTLDLNVIELLSYALEPSQVMLNEEFHLRIGTELLYLSKNMDKYEGAIIDAVKALLKLDKNPDNPTSMTRTFEKLMDTIIASNMSKNKKLEEEKIREFKKRLGII